MAKKLKYLELSDEDVIKEMEKRFAEMKKLLTEIRELLKTAGGIE